MQSCQRVITFAIGAVLLGATLFMLTSRGGPPPTVKGYLRAEDPSQIQRAIRRERWERTRACASKHEFKLFFGSCLPDLALGRVREIGSLPDRSLDGFGLSLTNPSSRAYALCGVACSRKLMKYGLQRTTNGWEVFSFGWP